MRMEAIRAALAPVMPDFDALLLSFEEEQNSTDPVAFLQWLSEKGHIDRQQLQRLQAADPLSTGTLAGAGIPDPSSTQDLIRIPPPPKGVRTAEPAAPRTADPIHARTPSYPPKPGANSNAPADVPGRGYKFHGKIGEGAMGEVLIAKDLDLHRTVAYKVMSESIAKQKSLATKFYGEAQITAQLDHPNIVPVYTLDLAPNGTLAYTMKLIRGRTLEKLVEETREQYKARKIDDGHSLSGRLELFLKVCDAIHYAHSRGVVHRDLKPENVRIGMYGEVDVMDWGIARLMEVPEAMREDLVLVEGYQEVEKLKTGDESDRDESTDTGMIIGTPQYMSPEQAHGQRLLDGKSDQYSLGLILYELVALKPAVTGKSPIKVVMRQQDAEKDPMIHPFGEAIPPELKAIVEKATQKKPQNRYPDVAKLSEDVRRYQRGEAVLARPDTIRQRVMRWVGRHRELTLFLVFIALSLTGSTVAISTVYGIYSQAVAAEREQQVTSLLTSHAAQAAKIDSHFARFEGLLGIVAASSVEMLIRGKPGEDPIFYAADFANEATAPDDLADAKRYGIPVSVEHPVFFISKNSDTVRVTDEFTRLTPVHRYLKRVMLLSKDESAASAPRSKASRLIRDIGTPIAWAQIGLSNGGYIGFPGQGALQDNFDPRQRPWYKLGQEHRDATWGAPYFDTAGLGILLPCAIPLYDDAEKPNFLGVAAIDLTYDYIIEDLLVTEGLPAGAESFLLDDQGKIVVRSSEKGKKVEGGALRNRTIRLEDFPVPEVVTAIKNLESGKQQHWNPDTQQTDLILFNRMNSLGWYYVVRGPEDALLGN